MITINGILEFDLKLRKKDLQYVMNEISHFFVTLSILFEKFVLEDERKYFLDDIAAATK